MSAEDPTSETSFSVFLIKINAQSLRQAETYLKNRNWTIGSATNMREAIAYIVQKQPEFVLICADHPNKKIRMLPKLLAQAFPVKTIAYTESSSPSSMQALREIAQKYTMFPPISGPAIERMILKVRKDELADAERLRKERENPDAATAGTDSASTNQGPDTVRLKGSALDPADLQKSFESARAALNQLVNSKDDDEGGPSGPAYMPDQANEQKEGGPGYFVAKGSGQLKGSDLTQENPDGDLGSINQTGSARGPGGANTQKNPEGDIGQLDPDSPEAKAALDYFAKQAAEAEKKSSGDFHPSFQKENEDEGFLPNSEKDSQGTSRQESSKKPKKDKLYFRGEKKETVEGIESIVLRGSIDALEKSIVRKSPSEESEINEVSEASNVACIIIESPRFSGYLIAALGKNRKIDKEFMEMVKSRLFGFLKANGEPVADEDSMGLKLQEVEFEGWAIEHAEFLKKTIHDGDEIAMAFFPQAEIATKLEASASEKMVKMSLQELKADVELEFDLYMYMPENNKYLLYTPQGRPLAGIQKNRLTEKGVEHMHLRKESIGDVKKYRAQNFLNEKIEAFKLAKKIKGE